MSGIVLDTNVVSEIRLAVPDAAVEEWFARQPSDSLFLTTTVVGELASSIEALPAGRRRTVLELWFENLLEADFHGRVLDYSVIAARRYGVLVAGAKARGRPPGISDAQIAAVAAVHGMTIATRDTSDFAAFGIPLVNPWTDA